MKHYGDITKLSGWTLPIVDVITGGSPCQDLSVAGKRAGLDGERSGLFMEQIRIVKEMRERDRTENGRTGFLVRPRYMVWENVPGAFSSNGGEDFKTVLEEIVKIIEPEVPDLRTAVQRGWTKSGCLYSALGEWSIAWRVHDAQFWGVPQRRKRIALVADFGGLSAPEVLFERKGLSGNPEQGKTQGKATAGSAGSGLEKTGVRVYGIGGYNSAGMLSSNPRAGIYEADTARTLDLNGGNPACNQGGIAVVYPTIARALTARMDGSHCIDRGPSIVCCAGFDGSMGAKAGNIGYQPEQAPTLNAEKEMHVYDARGNGNGDIAPTLTGDHQNRVTDYTALCICGEVTPTLVASAYKGPGNTQDGFAVCAFDEEMYNGTVRRLTPLECERLQGYPDGWTDIGDWEDRNGKKHKAADSPRYKALGNSIALPFWFWLLRRISAQYERPATLGSLFDGIGGFPLCWERCNGPGTAIWASEIEEFAIAVTKLHFPEDE